MNGRTRNELVDQSRKYLEHSIIKMRKWVAEAEALERRWDNEKADYMLEMADRVSRERREAPVHRVDIERSWETSKKAEAILASGIWAHRKANTYAQAALAERAWIDYLESTRN